MSAIVKLKRGEYLFKEGDAPDSLYIVKLGQISITKDTNDGNELQLATFSIGQMLGEMTFFDKSPRTANAKAHTDCEVIRLPFKALYSQFDKFPQWLKAMVKTIVSHVKTSNKKIKDLEEKLTAATTSKEMFTPQILTQIASILSHIGHKYKSDGPFHLPTEELRKSCIQIFSIPTYKMVHFLNKIESYSWIKQTFGDENFPSEISVLSLPQIDEFIKWLNDKQFKSGEKKEWTETEITKVKAFYVYNKTHDLLLSDSPHKTKLSDIAEHCNGELAPGNIQFLVQSNLVKVTPDPSGGVLLIFNPKELTQGYSFHMITNELLAMPPLS